MKIFKNISNKLAKIHNLSIIKIRQLVTMI
jgi:hypothetical protein